MLFSSSYVLLGLIAVIHAIPIDSPNGQTAPSHPRAVSLLDPRHLQAQLPPPPPRLFRDKIYISFFSNEPARTVCSNPMIQKELTLILTDYRQHLNVRSPFELSFMDDYGYDGDIHDNIHDVKFWGRGVGRDCERENSPCLVWYNHAFYERVPRPTTCLATVATADDDVLLDMTYAMRNRVLSESRHPVPVPDERWTSLCKVM